MFASPAVITINGVAKSLERVNQDRYSSEYLLRTPTEQFQLNIRNTNYKDKRGITVDRHNAELIHTIFAVAPAVNSTIRKAYVVIENQQGDTLVDPMHDSVGLLSFLTATSGANITRMLNFES